MNAKHLSEAMGGVGFTPFALFIFLVVFVGIVFFVLNKSRKGHYEKMAKLPFDKES
ncbi:MAG: CcoQ/FixQ family Cbb3-type cytochrome c oxidase assembly chaperone [Bdellovibrionaceae bacterium]|jgi:cbb3-type cytochrome oxidase subunit 3|nr:CcoQ/FixQ family Cbb3-type cytochrome c oxidase assembly chaperone [Pseudobdellovibrionaceae bacterium]